AGPARARTRRWWLGVALLHTEATIVFGDRFPILRRVGFECLRPRAAASSLFAGGERGNLNLIDELRELGGLCGERAAGELADRMAQAIERGDIGGAERASAQLVRELRQAVGDDPRLIAEHVALQRQRPVRSAIFGRAATAVLRTTAFLLAG